MNLEEIQRGILEREVEECIVLATSLFKLRGGSIGRNFIDNLKEKGYVINVDTLQNTHDG